MMELKFMLLAAIATLGVAQKTSPAIPPRGSPINDIPILGFGTWQLQASGNASEQVADAIVQGYRHIDAAWIYQNQVEVGVGIKEGLKRTGLKREDLWITGKLWNSKHGNEDAAIKETLRELQLDYLDLWLIHWPTGDSTGNTTYDHVKTWKNMEKTVRPTNGTRFIGLANFSPAQVTQILAISTIHPKVHQMELHPYLPQTSWIAENKRLNISVTGYSPFADTNPIYKSLVNNTTPILKNPVITSIATARNCTAAQVILAWNMRRGVSVIPKASQSSHRKENIETIVRCSLLDDDDVKINNIGVTLRLSTAVCNYGVLKADCFKSLTGV